MITIQLNNQLVSPSVLSVAEATYFMVDDADNLVATDGTNEFCIVAAGQWIYATKTA